MAWMILLSRCMVLTTAESISLLLRIRKDVAGGVLCYIPGKGCQKDLPDAVEHSGITLPREGCGYLIISDTE